MANTLHSRAIKWNHIGRRSNNGGLFPWAKREFKQRTNHFMRSRCLELQEWEQELLAEDQFKIDWMRQQKNLLEWQRFIAALDDLS